MVVRAFTSQKGGTAYVYIFSKWCIGRYTLKSWLYFKWLLRLYCFLKERIIKGCGWIAGAPPNGILFHTIGNGIRWYLLKVHIFMEYESGSWFFKGLSCEGKNIVFIFLLLFKILLYKFDRPRQDLWSIVSLVKTIINTTVVSSNFFYKMDVCNLTTVFTPFLHKEKES